MKDWQTRMIDDATADKEKRSIIRQIVEKQGFHAPDHDMSTMKGQILGPLDTVQFLDLVKVLADMSIKELQKVLEMDRV